MGLDLVLQTRLVFLLWLPCGCMSRVREWLWLLVFLLWLECVFMLRVGNGCGCCAVRFSVAGAALATIQALYLGVCGAVSDMEVLEGIAESTASVTPFAAVIS